MSHAPSPVFRPCLRVTRTEFSLEFFEIWVRCSWACLGVCAEAFRIHSGVCLYVCMHVYMYDWIRVCTYVCVCMYVCMYVAPHTYISMYLFMYVCMYVCMQVYYVHAGMHVCCTHTHLPMYVCMYVCMHACVSHMHQTCMYVWCRHACLQARVSRPLSLHVCKHTCTYVYFLEFPGTDDVYILQLHAHSCLYAYICVYTETNHTRLRPTLQTSSMYSMSIHTRLEKCQHIYVCIGQHSHCSCYLGLVSVYAPSACRCKYVYAVVSVSKYACICQHMHLKHHACLHTLSQASCMPTYTLPGAHVSPQIASIRKCLDHQKDYVIATYMLRY